MKSGSTKRIVVIRDIPSNFIEEAILILKGGSETDGNREPKTRKISEPAHDFLLKEAEMVINNYIKESRERAVSEIRRPVRGKSEKRGFFFNLVINSILIGSIALLIYLIIKITQMAG